MTDLEALAGLNLRNMVNRRDKVVDDQEILIGVMARALDVADRLIERGYGLDTPKEWNETFRGVAAARSALSRAQAEGEGNG